MVPAIMEQATSPRLLRESLKNVTLIYASSYMLTLQQMLEAAKTLSPEEREELCVALTGMQDDGAPPITEEAFAAGMESLGFLQRPRVPPQRAPFQPAATEGKPASEIIIEERR